MLEVGNLVKCEWDKPGGCRATHQCSQWARLHCSFHWTQKLVDRCPPASFEGNTLRSLLGPECIIAQLFRRYTSALWSFGRGGVTLSMLWNLYQFAWDLILYMMIGLQISVRSWMSSWSSGSCWTCGHGYLRMSGLQGHRRRFYKPGGLPVSADE